MANKNKPKKKPDKDERPYVQLNIYMSKTLRDRLWNFIKTHFKSPRFKMRPILETAITEYLDKHESDPPYE